MRRKRRRQLGVSQAKKAANRRQIMAIGSGSIISANGVSGGDVAGVGVAASAAWRKLAEYRRQSRMA